MTPDYLSTDETLRVWIAPVAKIYGIEAIENTTNAASADFDGGGVTGNNCAS